MGKFCYEQLMRNGLPWESRPRLPPLVVSAGTDGPLPAYSPRRRVQIAPPRSNGAGAAAPRPCHHPRAAPRRTRGRCPPRKAAERPKRRPSGPKSGTEEKHSGTDALEERLRALRPGLRRLRGPNRVS
jgi:hypothetical protein